jgi:hypothetical protein
MAQPVEKVLAARFQTIPDTARSLRQGGSAMAGLAQNPLAEPRSEFFNRLGPYRNYWCRLRGAQPTGLQLAAYGLVRPCGKLSSVHGA